jgi:hypothetical protein
VLNAAQHRSLGHRHIVAIDRVVYHALGVLEHLLGRTTPSPHLAAVLRRRRLYFPDEVSVLVGPYQSVVKQILHFREGPIGGPIVVLASYAHVDSLNGVGVPYTTRHEPFQFA